MLKAKGKYLILEPDKEVNKTKSGLLLVAKPKVHRGTIISKGEKVNLPVKVGDKVAFQKYREVVVKENGKEYYIVSKNNLLGKFE